MQIRIFAVLTMMASLTIAAPAAAQECDSVLSSGLLDESVVVDQKSRNAALGYSYCNKSYNEAKSDGSLELGISYGLFDGSGGVSDSDYSKKVQEICGSGSKSQNAQSLYYNAQKALNDKVVDAWRQCKIESVGLNCFVKPISGSTKVAISINFRSPGKSSAVVVRSSLINAINLSDQSLGGLIFQKGETIDGSDDIIVEIENASQPAIASLKIEYDGRNESCTVDFIAARSNSVRSKFELDGTWCIPADWDVGYTSVRFDRNGAFVRERTYDQNGNSLSDSWRNMRVHSDGRGFDLYDNLNFSEATCNWFVEKYGSDGQSLQIIKDGKSNAAIVCKGEQYSSYKLTGINSITHEFSKFNVVGAKLPVQSDTPYELQRCD